MILYKITRINLKLSPYSEAWMQILIPSGSRNPVSLSPSSRSMFPCPAFRIANQPLTKIIFLSCKSTTVSPYENKAQDSNVKYIVSLCLFLS